MTHPKKVRTSTYLGTVDVGQGFSLLYNGFTSRLDLLPTDLAAQLVNGRGWRDFSFLSAEEEQHLLNRGHLTGWTVRDELEAFKKLAEKTHQSNEALHHRVKGRRAIAFILTYQCNLSCTYCYQDDLRKNENLPAMDEAFVDDFFGRYIKHLMPWGRIKNAHFLLFGGEPFLPGNRSALERILRYALNYGASVSAASNAVLLPKMLDLIGPEKGKINNVQVTLDGDQLFHDQTRIPPSGAPTFEAIIHSLRTLIKVKARAVIRIHLHPNRLQSTRELVRYLDQEGLLGHDSVHVYFAPTTFFDGPEGPPSYFENLSDLFQDVSLKQNNPPSPFAGGFARIMDPLAMRNRLRLRYCAAGTGLLHVVDARGDLYDCYEEAGHKARRIGKLEGGRVKYFQLKETYTKRHILNIPECLKCSIALYCGGGCLSQARLKKGSIFKPFCHLNNEFVGQTLKAYYLLRQAGQVGGEGMGG
jgi:uncharacterized protein